MGGKWIKRIIVFMAIMTLAVGAFAADWAWVESENLAALPEMASTGAWGNADILSGGKVFTLNIGNREMESRIPESGVTLKYEFDAPVAGEYEAWNRLVFENIRTPFQWRVNGGEWMTNSQQDQPITNVQELSFWNPVGWSRMGEVALKKGTNILEVKILRQYKEGRKGKQQPDNIRYLSDAICFYKGSWNPNFKHKPDFQPSEDIDRKAAETVFSFADSSSPRTKVVLNGPWQYAPWDEVGEISEEQRVSGVEALPGHIPLTWYGIEVPSSRNTARPEFLYNHRAIYRTKVDVPADFEGRSFILNCEALSLIATLFINGRRVGDFGIVYGKWQPDITEFIKPGKLNEIALVMKDQFYAYSRNQKRGLRRMQYMPMSLFHRNQGVTMQFDYPVKGAGHAGIVDEVSLTATGPVYVEDVFVKPYPITRSEIEIDVTIAGNTGTQAEVSNRIEAWEETAQGGKNLGKFAIPVRAGQTVTKTIKTSSDGLDLWWTFEPALYNLVTEVSVDGKVVDREVTRFGVREWEHRGNQFYLNGVRQHLTADLTHYGARPDTDLARVLSDWKANGQNNFRLRFQFPWAGKTPREFLEWADEVGMPVRKNAGTFDGQHASYRLAVKEGDEKKANMPLFENWNKQMLNRAKARRNHPSVWIWELDNEIIYINARNFGNLDVCEPEFTRTSNELMAMDPTRYTITGGGNALMDESLPTYGPHYFEVNDRYYPDEAYTMERSIARQGTGEGGKVWPMDFDSRPTFMSETAFLPGRAPANFSQVMGESAFIGRSYIGRGTSLIADWLACGYRWRELGGTHFWFSDKFVESGHIHAWQPVAALIRQWNWTFGPKQKVARDLKIFNGTRHDDPINVKWRYVVGGKTAAEDEKEFAIPAGDDAMWQIEFKTPEVRRRQIADFIVTATHRGKEVYKHKRVGSVIPERKLDKPQLDGRLVAWDPGGEVVSRLKERGINHLQVGSMAEIPAGFELLIVGRNAVSKKEATDIQWIKWASGGRKILVLEQEHPLHYQAVGADLEPSQYDGRIVFSQNPDHPVFADIDQEDLSCWSGDHAVYKNVYEKATKGAVSLAHCDNMLNYSAISFLPVNDGAILLNQLLVGEKLQSDKIAEYIFDNMLNYMARYEKVPRRTAVVAEMETPTGKMIGGMGLTFESIDDPLAAIQNKDNDIVLVQATKDKMSKLVSNAEAVAAFNERGGWLTILGVTPETLDDYNKIVGYKHLIRPFEMEQVRFPEVRDPLTAGLGQSDVVMSTGKRIDQHRRDEWPADDAFAWILDIDDIAPFAEFPPPAYWGDPGTKGPGTDTWPRNMVNGFLAATHWRVIFSIHLMKNDPTSWNVELPREETITKLTIAPNTIYHRITEMQLVFDGDPDSIQTFQLSKDADIIELDVEPRKAKTLTVKLTEWDESGRNDVIGIDNLWITVERPEGFHDKVKPLLNIGGVIKYPRGDGGILLYQYDVRENESNPANKIKKQNVLGTLLRNLGAVFAGGNTIVAGEQSLRYEPVTLENYCNLYLSSERGWPNKKYDLSALPIDEQTFASVKYIIRDFKTSPLENAVTLKNRRPNTGVDAEKVADIRIGRQADALFFLHTFLQGREWKKNRRNPEPPVLWQYVINYADGSKETADVVYNNGTSAWLLRNEPGNLRDAIVAWTTPVGENNPMNAVVYQYQWTNPRPDKIVESIDLVYGPEGGQWGAPVLLGITVGNLIGD